MKRDALKFIVVRIVVLPIQKQIQVACAALKGRIGKKHKWMERIYDSDFVAELFDKMSGSYSRMNYITSFGFSARWRKQSVEQLDIKKGATVVDLMTGMGECWKYILKKEHQIKQLIALDISTEMIKRAKQNRLKYDGQSIEIRHENVFKNKIKSESAEYVISGFGLKTFDEKQLKNLAAEIDRILKKNGTFSLIDVSVPEGRILRSLYLFYLKQIIPMLGRLLLGNPETYKMLGIYTERFKNSKRVLEIFESQGFEVAYVDYFFGCASGIKGKKQGL